MADDPVTAALTEVRRRQAECKDGFSSDALAYIRSAGDVPRLLTALDAVLAPHAPRSDVLCGRSCITHRPLKPVPDCMLCTQDQRREVCPECRDEYGDPVLFQDCRARSAVLAALAGEGKGRG